MTGQSYHLPDARHPLGFAEARRAFDHMMDGDSSDEEIKNFLVTMNERGETADEIAGAASSLRARAAQISPPEGAIDVCGTGGDGQHTRNVSTTVAIVVAACGVPVAKHGNRAASSKSGAADVLEALGVNVDMPLDRVERCLHELGIGFLFAVNHHRAMARVAPVRRALKRRTIFNIVGPLSNPAQVQRQLIGVFAADLITPVTQALLHLDIADAMVVHGDDGLDELSIFAPSHVGHVHQGRTSFDQVSPDMAGLPAPAGRPDDRHDLQGGDAAENAIALRALLKGHKGAYRDIVILNAAGALMVAGRATDWHAGAEMAARAIDDGAAHDLLERWVHFT